MSRTKKAAPAEGKVQARCLVDSEYGKCNDVVEVGASELELESNVGVIDGDAASVEYALTLFQNGGDVDKPAEG